MKPGKKVTDFIVLDEGNIGRKAAVMTGATLAASVLGTVLMAPQEAQAYPHCDCHSNSHSHHVNHIPEWCSWHHSNSYTDSHMN